MKHCATCVCLVRLCACGTRITTTRDVCGKCFQRPPKRSVCSCGRGVNKRERGLCGNCFRRVGVPCTTCGRPGTVAGSCRVCGSGGDRQRLAKINRWREQGWTLQKIGDQFGITRQRVEQLIRTERHHARVIVYQAIARGTLVKPPTCSRCEAMTALQAHHEDYLQPLVVEWLCAPCHAIVHPHHPKVRRAEQMTFDNNGNHAKVGPPSLAIQSEGGPHRPSALSPAVGHVRR